jgi:hypothetical protein
VGAVISGTGDTAMVGAPRLARSLIAGLALVGTMTACRTSTDTRGHQRLAADTIVEQAAKQGVELRNANCEKPTSANVGTSFKCTAEDQDGFEFRFTAEIAPDDTYNITPNG